MWLTAVPLIPYWEEQLGLTHAQSGLVLGAYGHSRWGEVLLGGVSQAVIRNATMPVLLAH